MTFIKPERRSDSIAVNLGRQMSEISSLFDGRTNELATIVGAGQKDDSNAQDISIGDALSIGRISFEDELVDTDGDRADEERVELLIILIARAKN